MAVATDNGSALSNAATTTGTVYPTGGYVVNSTADNVAVDAMYKTSPEKNKNPFFSRIKYIPDLPFKDRTHGETARPFLMGRKLRLIARLPSVYEVALPH